MHCYGHKPRAAYSIKSTFQSVDVSVASVHDIRYLKDIRSQIANCVLTSNSTLFRMQNEEYLV